MEHRSGPPGPVRTCVGCRKRGPRSGLLRVVARPARRGESAHTAADLVPDPECRLPGRGAWLHRSGSCLDAAQRRRAFGRALRVRGTPCADALTRYVQQAVTPEPEQAQPGVTMGKP